MKNRMHVLLIGLLLASSNLYCSQEELITEQKVEENLLATEEQTQKVVEQVKEEDVFVPEIANNNLKEEKEEVVNTDINTEELNDKLEAVTPKVLEPKTPESKAVEKTEENKKTEPEEMEALMAELNQLFAEMAKEQEASEEVAV